MPLDHRPSFDLNLEVVQQAEHFGFDFLLLVAVGLGFLDLLRGTSSTCCTPNEHFPGNRLINEA